jgi:hypothetical protein
VEARKTPRGALKVIHRHRIDSLSFRRVSELVFLGGGPKAVLAWVNMAGVRTPIYCALDPAKLRQPAFAAKGTFYYDETTVDPRYQVEDAKPQGESK